MLHSCLRKNKQEGNKVNQNPNESERTVTVGDQKVCFRFVLTREEVERLVANYRENTIHLKHSFFYGCSGVGADLVRLPEGTTIKPLGSGPHEL
jgi:hypothetical protein